MLAHIDRGINRNTYMERLCKDGLGLSRSTYFETSSFITVYTLYVFE